MQKRIFDCKKCKECKKICLIPSWVYCSDECNRINVNKKQLKKIHEKKKIQNIK